MAFDKLYIAIYITVHENNIYVLKKALLKVVNKFKFWNVTFFVL